jgi:nitric oxide reductase NorE protein
MTTVDRGVASTIGRTGRVPGQPDIWFFVFFESLVFTSYFGVYLYNRAQHEQSFLRSQSQLDLWLGILETIALLTSSWAIARSVQASRDGKYDIARREAYLTAAFGLVFLALKIGEWARQIRLGNTFTSSDFFQYFYFLTVIHFIHLLIGFVALGILVYQLASPTRRSQELIETCATYWHTVDFFWVLIFALLYVVR